MSEVGRRHMVLGAGLATCAAGAVLSGCDVLLVSPTLPGLLPGLGQPLHGRVLDALSGQPIGHASVMGDVGKGDLGWATTDNDGNFALYGDISRQVVSIDRAGYTAVTYEDGGIVDGREYFLQPLFPSTGEYHHVKRTIQGQFDVYGPGGQPQLADALHGAAFLGDQSTTVNGGNFAFPEITTQLPGYVYSGVLGGGDIGSGDPITGPFNFQLAPDGTTIDFAYQIVNVPFVDTPTASPWVDPQPLILGKTFATTANVTYTNASWANKVETDVSLDFGQLGSILVARQFVSNQAGVQIPSIGASYKYILAGTASSADGNQRSQVTIDTDQRGAGHAAFSLLSPPHPLSPGPGAKGVGPHPVFSWAPVADADSYVVKVIEQDNPIPKWQAVVNAPTTAIGYPWFGDGDINGGALLPGATYSWEVHAVSASFEQTSPAALDPTDILPASVMPATGPMYPVPAANLARLSLKAGPIFAPYNKRTRESYTKGMEFFR